MNDYRAFRDDYTPPEEVERRDEGEHSFIRWLLEVVGMVLLALVVAWFLREFVVQPFYIPSGSMEPTLMPGDRVLVSKLSYRMGEPAQRDVVVFKGTEGGRTIDLIKRVVALGGETVQVRDGELYVEGKKQDEPYVAPVRDFSAYGPFRVPEGTVFVMGDNRTNSRDSRFIGPIPLKDLLGKAFIVYWPLSLQPGQERLL
jgi:signal peptidase I